MAQPPISATWVKLLLAGFSAFVSVCWLIIWVFDPDRMLHPLLAALFLVLAATYWMGWRRDRSRQQHGHGGNP